MRKPDLSDLNDELGMEDDDSVLTGVSSSGSFESRAAKLDAQDELAARFASLMVRRMCNQHDCKKPSTGVCDHAAHRRDVDYLRHCLEVLDLPRALPQVTDEDRKAYLSGEVPRPRPKR